eukprot:487997_1
MNFLISSIQIKPLIDDKARTFLEKIDHFTLQKVCKRLTIIGRRKQSFNSKTYEKHGKYLIVQHQLPFIIKKLLHSENELDWEIAGGNLNRINVPLGAKPLCKAMSYSGIITILLNRCRESDEIWWETLWFVSREGCEFISDLVNNGYLDIILNHILPTGMYDIECLQTLFSIASHNDSIYIQLSKMNVLQEIILSMNIDLFEDAADSPEWKNVFFFDFYVFTILFVNI